MSLGPPPVPPNRTIQHPGYFSLGGETEESKEETAQYERDSTRWRENLERSKK